MLSQQQSKPDKRSFMRTQLKVIFRRVCVLLIATSLATLPSILYQVSESQATPARASVRTPFKALVRDSSEFPPSGWPKVLDDQLTNNAQGYGWAVGTSGSASCTFSSSFYDVTSSSQASVTYCRETNYVFSSVAFEVTMQIIAGDEGGIVFDSGQGNWYVFKIYQDKNYTLDSYINGTNTTVNGTPQPQLPNSIDPTQPNPIAIVVQESTLSLYVNGVQINSQQISFSSGWIGLIAGTSSSDYSADVHYSNAHIWSPSTPTSSKSPLSISSGSGPGGDQ
jgi:hypothetical protein